MAHKCHINRNCPKIIRVEKKVDECPLQCGGEPLGTVYVRLTNTILENSVELKDSQITCLVCSDPCGSSGPFNVPVDPVLEVAALCEGDCSVATWSFTLEVTAAGVPTDNPVLLTITSDGVTSGGVTISLEEFCSQGLIFPALVDGVQVEFASIPFS